MEQVEQAVRKSNENGTGGYLDRQGPSELLVRSLGRITSLAEAGNATGDHPGWKARAAFQFASVREGAQIKRAIVLAL